MKHYLIILPFIIFSLILLTAEPAPQSQPYQTIKVSDGWEEYTSPPMITKDIAQKLKPGQTTPEAAVIHFYAGLMRGDNSFKEILPPKDQQSADLKETLEEIKQWSFIKIQLRKRKQFRDNCYWVSIFMEIEIQGKKDQGTDEVDVRFIDGKWTVFEPPI